MTTPITSIAKGEVLAMTAPVTQIRGISGHWLVRFTMPSVYMLADLLRADDARVQLRDLPGSRVAVLRFSGLTGLRKVAAQAALLLQQAAQRGLRATEPIALSRYNPP